MFAPKLTMLFMSGRRGRIISSEAAKRTTKSLGIRRLRLALGSTIQKLLATVGLTAPCDTTPVWIACAPTLPVSSLAPRSAFSEAMA